MPKLKAEKYKEAVTRNIAHQPRLHAVKRGVFFKLGKDLKKVANAETQDPALRIALGIRAGDSQYDLVIQDAAKATLKAGTP